MSNNASRRFPVSLPACLALVCAIVLSFSLLIFHLGSVRELADLNRRFDETTADWKRIDGEKQELLTALAELENRITDAEDDIASAQKRAGEIASLKSDIEALRSQLK